MTSDRAGPAVAPAAAAPLLQVEGLRKKFNLEAGFFARFGAFVYAVNGVTFSIGQNETYGLVGESGCGKTTTARLIARMYEADQGAIRFQGRDARAFAGQDLRTFRRRVKYVFQDPARSLNPRMTVYDVLTSGPRWSGMGGGGRAGARRLRDEAAAILEEVGLSAADLERRPAEFSGGQRQRISIARGLLMKPDLLICDEVVSALDVSIQGQILNLLQDIRARRALSFLFIAHDLKVACYFCDRIGVMYRGELMEEAPAADLYRAGIHPYTALLFSSVPGWRGEGTGVTAGGAALGAAAGVTAGAAAPGAAAGVTAGGAAVDRGGVTAGGAAGATTGAAALGAAAGVTAGAAAGITAAVDRGGAPGVNGCPFAPRCPRAMEQCRVERAPLRDAGSGHLVRCHHAPGVTVGGGA